MLFPDRLNICLAALKVCAEREDLENLLRTSVETVCKLERYLSSFRVRGVLCVVLDFMVHKGSHVKLEEDEARTTFTPTLT